jgi:hypothetical protein
MNRRRRERQRVRQRAYREKKHLERSAELAPQREPRNAFSLAATLALYPDLKDAYIPAEDYSQIMFGLTS